MKALEIYVPGTPVAQSRPRFARRGQFVTTYDAAPARDFKSWVRDCAIKAMKAQGFEMFKRDIPLAVRFEIGLLRPKSKPKKVIYPTTKPDYDNIIKGVQDAMESIVYEADQQIVSSSATKRYSENPGVRVYVWIETL